MADLVTASEVANALPALATDPDLSALISVASAAVEAACGQAFTQAAVDVYLDGRDKPSLWLDRLPIASITAITIDGTEILTTDQYSFHPETGELRRNDGRSPRRWASRWPEGMRRIRVQYTGGPATIPPLVKRATLLTLKALKDAAPASGAYQSESIGDYSYSLKGIDEIAAVPPQALALLSMGGHIRTFLM